VDSEHRPANVPLGLQHLINFQANPNLGLPSLALLNSLQVAADWVNTQIAQIAQAFQQNPAANQVTGFTPASPNGPLPERNTLMAAFTGITGNTSGYPEFVRRVGISMGSGVGTTVPHASAEIFDSQLKMNPFGDSYTETDCKGQYTVYRPVAKKTTTARWWSSNNNQNIFDGHVMINGNWTIM